MIFAPCTSSVGYVFARRIWPAFMLGFIMSLAGVHAQAQTTRTLTLDEAIRIGLDQDIDLKKASNQLELQGLAVRKERADFLPNFNLSANPSISVGFAFDQTSLQLVNRRTEGFNFGGASSINLFNGFADVASLNRARLNLDADDRTRDRARQRVIQNVINNFLQVILDRERIHIQEENVEYQRQLLARIEEFTRVGTRPVSDLYQQQFQAAQAESNLLSAQRSYQINQSRLIQVLQLNPFDNYEFSAPSTEEIPLIPENYDLQALLQNAFEQRADLQARRYRLDAGQESIREAKAGYLPVINLSTSYGSSYTSANPILNFSDQLDSNRGGSLRMSINIPIFNRFNNQLQVQRAIVSQDNAKLDLQNLEQSVAIEVRQAYLDYQTDIKRLDVTEKQLKAGQQALDAEQERYNVGASTLVELTQARSNYVQAVSERAQAVYQFILRGRLLDYAVGTLDPDQKIFE